MDLNVIKNLHRSIGTMLLRSKNSVNPTDRAGLTARNCPVLQDINWDIAEVLKYKWNLPTEEVALTLVDRIEQDCLRECRDHMFHIARGQYLETLADIHTDVQEEPPIVLKLKQRRGAAAAPACARDLIQLFHFICGITSDFPADLLSSGCKLHGPRQTGAAPCNEAIIADGDAEQGSPGDVRDTILSAADGDGHTQAPSPCQCDVMQQTVADLVIRCMDYDKALLDMRYQLNEAIDEIASLKQASTHGQHLEQSLPASCPRTLSDASSSSASIASLSPASATGTASGSESGMNTSTPHQDDSYVILDDTDTAPPHASDDPEGSDIPSPRSLTDMMRDNTPVDPECPDKMGTTGEQHPPQQTGIQEWRANTDCVMDRLLVDVYLLKENYIELEQGVATKSQQKYIKKQLKRMKGDNIETKQCLNNLRTKVEHNTQSIKTIQQTCNNARPNIECRNRFSVLADECDEAPHDDAEQAASWAKVAGRKQKRRKPKPPRAKTRVSIIGSSLVRGLGSLVNADDISACCYTNPGCGTDELKDRIAQMSRPNDEVVMLQCGSNNIQRDDAKVIMDKLDEIIDDTKRMRPFANIIMAPIPQRLDIPELNPKIQSVNDFLKRKCSKLP